MKRLHLATAALLLLAAGAATAQPVRRAGEWQVTMSSNGGPPGPPKIFCYAEGSVADITKRMGAACTRHDVHTVGNQLTIDAECAMGTHQSKVHTVVTSHGPNAYHAEVQMTVSPPMPGMASSSFSQDAKWLGPCAAGEKPTL